MTTAAPASSSSGSGSSAAGTAAATASNVQESNNNMRTTPQLFPMTSIAISTTPERQQNALVGQFQHFRERRLAVVEERRRRLGSESGSHTKHHPASWRQQHIQPQNRQRSLLTSDTPQDDTPLIDSKPIITSLELSNCHLVLYSGEIALGSNKQRFRVDFDTASSDLWVPSNNCQDCTAKHPTWRLFNATQSTSFQPATEDASHQAFDVEYEDGEVVHGDHGVDTLWLGDDTLQVDYQVFAAVTQVDNFATCQEEEGILGLANSLTTSHHFPSLLGNVLHSSSLLKHNMFGMYLHSQDDYDDEEESARRNLQQTTNNSKPQKASSQLVLGGVDQLHYVGCLQWHGIPSNVVEQDSDTNESATAARNTESNYWSLPLQQVKVGGQEMVVGTDGNTLAILDSGSSYIVGPQPEVAQLVQMNGAKCFTLEQFDGASPTQVDCDSNEGFDGALLQNCNDPFFNLEFVINGISYILEKEDLMVQVDTLFGEACILRIVGAIGMEGWVLGDAFLNKYYAAFDFEQQRIGLALAADNALDVCEQDMDLDINHFWQVRDDMDGEQASQSGGIQEEQEEPFEGDPDDQEDVVNPDDAQEVFDYEDAQQLPSEDPQQVEEDFDFSHVTDAPGSDGGDVVTNPPPSHNEPPERQPVPHMAPSPSPIADTSFTAELPGQHNAAAATATDSNIAIYVVIAAVVAFAAAFLVRKTSQRRQQAMFHETWREAEREIVSSHKNLNYRDHHASSTAKQSVVPYRDGGFHDEETPAEDGDKQEDFVLDRDMLNRMN